MHSEMGPVRQNPIHRTAKTAHLSMLTTVYNFSTQYNTEQCSNNHPSDLQTSIIAQMLSIGGEARGLRYWRLHKRTVCKQAVRGP